MESRFIDNAVYSAEDVNRAFAGLTAQGVSVFSDTKKALTDLNAAMANLMTPGIELATPDACRVVKEDSGYFISPGTAYMPNGAVVTVDADRYQIEPAQGSVSYVYFKTTGKEILPIVSENEPGDDCLLLAIIGADDKVVDKRTWAATKFYPIANNFYKETFTYYNISFVLQPVCTISLGVNKFKYIFIGCFLLELKEGEVNEYCSRSGSEDKLRYVKNGDTIDIEYKQGLEADETEGYARLTIFLF